MQSVHATIERSPGGGGGLGVMRDEPSWALGEKSGVEWKRPSLTPWLLPSGEHGEASPETFWRGFLRFSWASPAC